MSKPWIRETTNKLIELPRLSRREIDEILKDVFQKGIDHSEKKIIRMYQKYGKK